jgi:16S rRNA processing protein RimM
MDSTSSDDVVVIGRIQGAFGVQGWIRLTSYTDPADNILRYSPWLLQDGSSWRSLDVLAAKAQRNGFVARLAEIADRDAAAALRGRLIGIAAAALPQAEHDEYYWRDLVGLKVLNVAGEPVGRVLEVMATGANDVLVVALDEALGVAGAKELIPFHRQFVPEVDLEQGTLTVDWTIGESI